MVRAPAQNSSSLRPESSQVSCPHISPFNTDAVTPLPKNPVAASAFQDKV